MSSDKLGKWERVWCWAMLAGCAALFVVEGYESVTEKPKRPVPIPTATAACPPCPSATDNAKLREAHAMCDADRKVWEQRARNGEQK